MNEIPTGCDKPAGELPSLVVPGMVSTLSILPLTMVAALSPAMLRRVHDGAMGLPCLAGVWAACACVVAALATMFLRRRGASVLFAVAALLGVACAAGMGEPFARLALGVAIAAAIGAVVASLQARRQAGRAIVDDPCRGD